jgi:hypothetical protein
VREREREREKKLNRVVCFKFIKYIFYKQLKSVVIIVNSIEWIQSKQQD